MNIELREYEKITFAQDNKAKKMTDNEINAKYERGEHRIVTEQGAIKLDLINSIFEKEKYNLRPEFQRRITWDTKKRSKLIESFIMNIPVPPVFLYEENFSSYVVMDGLQRISAIMEFYNNNYALSGLEEWSELNGKKYKELPEKIQEGIDRRQLSVITLLKESAEDEMTADTMKKMVFERLNTGGVQLQDQEIRNALYAGKFNDFCIKMSENKTFKALWGLENVKGTEESEGTDLDDEEALSAAKNKLYRRMYDVELVLRYFTMRNVENYSGKLSRCLDNYLNYANGYDDNKIKELREIFEKTIQKAYALFGEKAFCIYRTGKGWSSSPQNMVYDAMMLALSDKQVGSCKLNEDVQQNIDKLADFYSDNAGNFNGKKQSKVDIVTRANLLNEFILKELAAK